MHFFFGLGRPDDKACKDALVAGLADGLNVAHPGATNGGLPLRPPADRAAYVVDHNMVQVGSGRDTFTRATALLKRWGHFQLGWAEVDERTPVVVGQPVCVVSNTLGVWARSPLQVTYVETTPARRRTDTASFRFASATLGGHFLEGEERFGVEWRPDGTVWFDILTFSRPAHALAALVYPIIRLEQLKFVRESLASVRRALAPPDAAPAAVATGRAGTAKAADAAAGTIAVPWKRRFPPQLREA